MSSGGNTNSMGGFLGGGPAYTVGSNLVGHNPNTAGGTNWTPLLGAGSLPYKVMGGIAKSTGSTVTPTLGAGGVPTLWTTPSKTPPAPSAASPTTLTSPLPPVGAQATYASPNLSFRDAYLKALSPNTNANISQQPTQLASNRFGQPNATGFGSNISSAGKAGK